MKVNQNLIPIVFGITGHRDIREEDVLDLQIKIKDIFLKTIEKYPNTPIMLLTPLAQGADQIAAKVALELGKIELIVPLPMHKEEYLKDFETEDDKKDFLELLSKADRCFELPLVEGNTIENIKIEGTNRDKQYEQVGVYIARHSQILIALWDGVVKPSTCGTYQIVYLKLSGEAESYAKEQPRPLEPLENGPVYHILTPRKSNHNIIEEKYKLVIKYPENHQGKKESEKDFLETLSYLNTYNRDVENNISNLKDKIKDSKNWLFSDEETNSFTEDMSEIVNHYSIADILSVHFRKKRERILITQIVLVLIAALFFVTYKSTKNIVFLTLYPSTLFIALLYYFSVKKRDYKNKHQDYRALAEGLRVQIFWDYFGIKKDVSKYYLRKHKHNLEWIRFAIRIINIPKNNQSDMSLSNSQRINGIKEKWLNEQLKYFVKRENDYNKKLRRSGPIINIFFKVSFISCIALVVVYSIPLNINKDLCVDILLLCMRLLPVLAAALITYNTKLSFKELSNKYNRMGELFSLALDLLDKYTQNNEIEKIKELIIDLGKEALIENADWVILNRDKKIDRPIK